MNFLKRIKFIIKAELESLDIIFTKSANQLTQSRQMNLIQQILAYFLVISLAPFLICAMLMVVIGVIPRYFKRIRRKLK